MFWLVSKRRFDGLLAEFREMQSLYWYATSEVVDLRIDLANAVEQVERLEGKTTIKVKVVDEVLTNVEPVVLEVVEGGYVKQEKVR